MSFSTNKEWIDANNDKINDIIDLANNLPEYQDIEPIYANIGLKSVALPNNLNYTWVLDNKIIMQGALNGTGARYGSKDYLYFYIINNDDTLTYVGAYNASASTSGGIYTCTILLDYDDEYIYFIRQQGTYQNTDSSVTINTIKIEDGTIGSFTASYGTTVSFYKYFTGVKGLIDTGGVLYKFDKDKKTFSIYNSAISFTYSNSYTDNKNICIGIMKFSNNVLTQPYYQRIWFLDQVKLITTSGKITTVIEDSMKILIENSLYVINNDYSLGGLVKSNVIENYTDDLILFDLGGNRFIGSNNNLYYFDDSTNEFLLLDTIYSVSGKLPEALNLKSDIDHTIVYVPDIDYNTIVGVIYNGEKMYPDTSSVTSKDLLNGKYLYTYGGVRVIGSMSDNGALNYTPSTSPQTIPVGYTSGGTIAAVSMSESDIQEAEDQIANLFGEGGNS